MKIKSPIPLLLGLAGLTSMFLVSVGYVVMHKPFSAENLTGLLTAAWQVAAAAAILTFAGGLGEFLLSASLPAGLTRLAAACALGIAGLSVIVLLLGTIAGTGPALLVIPLLVLGVLLRREIRSWFANFAELRAERLGRYEIIVLAAAALIFAMRLSIALAPPTGFDALVYHFAIPASYLEAGRITYLPDTMFWGMPQTTEMLYLLAMRIGGVEAAAVTGVLVAVVCLIGLWGFVNSSFSSAAAFTSIAALLAGETLTTLLSTGYVEWTAILFGWAATVMLTGWLENRNRKLLVLTGIFCGAALGTKYTGGVLLLACLVAAASLGKQAGRPFRFRDLALLGAAAAVSSLPWWIKNTLATGNPFYPFFFAAGAMDAMRIDFYQGAPPWNTWRAVILLPWQATIWGLEGKEGFSASIGPLLAGLSPFAGINWRGRDPMQRTAILCAAVIAVAGLLIWAVASRLSALLIQTRLYFVIFPAWAILAGVAFDALWPLQAGGVRFGRLIGALVLLMLGLNVFSAGRDFITADPLRYVLRLEDQQAYLIRNTGAFAESMTALNGLPEDSRVLLLWEPRGFYCQPVCDSDEAIDRWFQEAGRLGLAEEITERWSSQGFTHVMIFQVGADFIRARERRASEADWQLLQETLNSLTLEKDIAGIYALYRLGESQP